MRESNSFRLSTIFRMLGAAALLGLLSACYVSGDDEAYDGPEPIGYKQLNLGVPVLLGASASGVQYRDGVGVTVAHNKIVIRNRIWSHPTHDIAFFKLDREAPEWREVKNGDTVTAYGNSILRRNRVLTTEVTDTETMFWSVLPDKIYITRHGFTSGMSGGPIYDEEGHAVGIVLGTITRDPPKDEDAHGKVHRGNGIFVPTSQIDLAFVAMCDELGSDTWPCDQDLMRRADGGGM